MIDVEIIKFFHLFFVLGKRSTRGGREENEDRYKVEDLGNRLYYFGVFDGHRGSHAADYVTSHLHKFIDSRNFF